MLKKSGNRTFNNTINMYKHINQYSADVFNNCIINETHSVKKTYQNCTNGAFINKHNTININDTYIVTKNKMLNITDNKYYTKRNLNKNNITNNTTRHNHNNYEHNAMKKAHKHIKHIHNYDTDENYSSKKPHNKNNRYNFYNGNFNFRKIENISLSQQTDITNNITETNTRTINYVDNKYVNNNKIATVIVNPTPSLTENYLWIPEGITDNVVPGLDSLSTYAQNMRH